MLNLHLNGDIVRCPDIIQIKKRISEQNNITGHCRYGMKEDNCQVWQSSLKAWTNPKKYKNISTYYQKICDLNRCPFAGSDICPGNIKHKSLGSLQKSFKIDTVIYRKLASATHDLIKTSEFKTLFVTLTFPKFKIKPNEKHINKAFSKFVENLRETYNCTGYIAVRERGGNNNRYHFHLICSIPFVKFNILNDAWYHSISDICHYSKNALRTTKKSLYIRNPVTALRYVCKYFSKCRGQTSKTRLVFMSNNLIKKPIPIPGEIKEILKGYKGVYINQTSDYTTCYRITNPSEFHRFCKNFLYDAFNEYWKFPIFNKDPVNFYAPGSN